MQRCTGCKGKKKVWGLGMMESDCKVCNGVGYTVDVKKEDKQEEKEVKPKTQKKSISRKELLSKK